MPSEIVVLFMPLPLRSVKTMGSFTLPYLPLQLPPFYGCLNFVRDYPGEPVPERQNQEAKTNLDQLEQETVSGSGISWAM